jgi:hypothetical protein
MPTDAQIHDLAAAAWEILVEFGRDGHTASETAKAALRIAYEPFQEAYDPHAIAPPPMTLAAAEEHIASLARQLGGSLPDTPPLHTLAVTQNAHGRYDVGTGRDRAAVTDFSSVEAAQAYIALTYGISAEAVKAQVPTRLIDVTSAT